MAFEQKDMSGALFKNDRKTEDSHPNAKGSCKIGGVEYWVAAWTKKDKNGNPFQSLSFQAKERQAAPPPTQRQRADQAVRDIPSDCPF